jgi:hypothetical protein
MQKDRRPFSTLLGREKKNVLILKETTTKKKSPWQLKVRKPEKKKEIKYARTHPVHPEKMWVDIKFSHTFSLKKKITTTRH